VNEHREVHEAADITALFAEGCVHTVDVPASEGDLRRLHTELFATARPSDPLLMASASGSDFSWELVNRLIFTQPTFCNAADLVQVVDEGARVGDREFALLLLPSSLGDDSRLDDARRHTQNAVILVRRNTTPITDVDALARLLHASGFTIRGVVIVHSEQTRWRKWRRFARAYGVWSDPERPWPTIDVLEDEKIRTARPRERRRES
jgi:hypothetical protein